MHHPLPVGTVVRVRISDSEQKRKLSGQATVATVEAIGHDYSYCVLMNDSAPQKIEGQEYFLVIPMFEVQDQQGEQIVSSLDVMELLDFENGPHVKESYNKKQQERVALRFKERGDALFKLGDVTMAASWYELALSASNNLSVGDVVAVKKKQNIAICDVDCIEDDSVDVTNCQNHQEETVATSQILLCLMDEESFLQERILLNLSRCLLQLAQLSSFGSLQNRPYQYRRAATLACTLVLEILTYKQQQNDSNTKSLQESALLLRGKSYAERHKWKLAIDSLQQLLSLNPKHREGLNLQKHIQLESTAQKKSNQKLAKAVCVWVDKASSTTNEATDDSHDAEVTTTPNDDYRFSTDENALSTTRSPRPPDVSEKDSNKGLTKEEMLSTAASSSPNAPATLILRFSYFVILLLVLLWMQSQGEAVTPEL